MPVGLRLRLGEQLGSAHARDDSTNVVINASGGSSEAESFLAWASPRRSKSVRRPDGVSGPRDQSHELSGNDEARRRLSAVADLDPAEDRTAQSAGAVSERFLSDAQRVQNTEVHIRHSRLAVTPVGAMLESHIGSARD